MLKNILLIFVIALCLLAPFFGVMAILAAVITSYIITRSAKRTPETQ